MNRNLDGAPSDTEREIRQQPDAWRRAAELAPQFAPMLPHPGERVAVIGCGTSWFVANAYARLREETGAGETDFFTASEFPADRGYDRVLAISRSGTTTEVLRAMAATKAPVTVVTAVPASPVTTVADDSIVLDFADERSVVQTLFATTALALLRASLGALPGDVADQAEAVLADRHRLPAELAAAEQISFLGQGWAGGIALEAGLKLREAAQLWTESYLQMEYRHGPIAIAQPGRAVWIFGAPVDGLLDDVARTGATVVTSDLDPLADLVRAQLYAVARAQRAGLDPDAPRHLTRSVVLDPAT
jgi:fructoselysine-6-P-deglycase FrlB-like protein